MRTLRSFCVSLAVLAATPALAGPTFGGQASAEQPLLLERNLSVERLRIAHFGGEVQVMPSWNGKFVIMVTEVENLPAKRFWMAPAPRVEVVVEEVSPGNFFLTTKAPKGSTVPELQADTAYTVHSGSGVSMGAAVVATEDDVVSEGASAQRFVGATHAKLVVQVPQARFQHLSVVTGFADVLVKDFVFPPVVEPTRVFHGKTGSGRIRLESVRGVRFLASTGRFTTEANCLATLVTGGHEAILAEAFRN